MSILTMTTSPLRTVVMGLGEEVQIVTIDDYKEMAGLLVACGRRMHCGG